MAGILSIEEARLACRVDGSENDDIIRPIMEAAETYVLTYVGDKYNPAAPDPRIKQAASILVQRTFRPEEDKQDNLLRFAIALLKQVVVSV